MRERIISLARDPFIKNNAVFFLGSLVVAALNYAYHPILSRVLSVQSFGDLEVILVIYAQVGIVLGIFSKIAINHITQEWSAEDQSIIRELYSFAAITIGGFALIVTLWCVPLTSLFHLNSVYSVLILVVLILLSIPGSFQTSILQGTHNFVSASIASAIQAGGRLALAAVFILLGFGLTGAIIALALAQLASVIYTYTRTHTLFPLRITHLPSTQLFKKELPYALLILITGACITLLYNSDIAFVKYFFDAQTAGLYSGISVIDNALFFITGSIAGVLLPSIRRTHTFAQNNRSLIQAVILTTFIGGSVLIVFCLFPSLVVKIMIGGKYLEYAHYLPALGCMVFMVSLSNLFISFFLALRKYLLVPISLCGLIVLSCGIAVFHSTITGIITSYIVGSGVTLLLLIGYYFYYFIHERAAPILS